MNLYSNDAQRIFDAISSLPALFAGPVYIVLVIIYCVVLVGPWAILGCAVLFLYLPCQVSIVLLDHCFSDYLLCGASETSDHSMLCFPLLTL